VANYIVRLQVGTHVTASLMFRLPVPRPSRSTPAFTRVAALADTLQADPRDVAAHAELQACAARLYGLSAGQFEHVLDSFPLVSVEERAGALRTFRAQADP
jgi:hypothetical protein